MSGFFLKKRDQRLKAAKLKESSKSKASRSDLESSSGLQQECETWYADSSKLPRSESRSSQKAESSSGPREEAEVWYPESRGTQKRGSSSASRQETDVWYPESKGTQQRGSSSRSRQEMDVWYPESRGTQKRGSSSGYRQEAETWYPESRGRQRRESSPASRQEMETWFPESRDRQRRESSPESRQEAETWDPESSRGRQRRESSPGSTQERESWYPESRGTHKHEGSWEPREEAESWYLEGRSKQKFGVSFGPRQEPDTWYSEGHLERKIGSSYEPRQEAESWHPESVHLPRHEGKFSYKHGGSSSSRSEKVFWEEHETTKASRSDGKASSKHGSRHSFGPGSSTFSKTKNPMSSKSKSMPSMRLEEASTTPAEDTPATTPRDSNEDVPRDACAAGPASMSAPYTLAPEVSRAVKEALDHVYLAREYQTMGLCTVCKRICIRTCSNCGLFYCNVECQAYDWPKHKQLCLNPETEEVLSEEGRDYSNIPKSLGAIHAEQQMLAERPRPFTSRKKPSDIQEEIEERQRPVEKKVQRRRKAVEKPRPIVEEPRSPVEGRRPPLDETRPAARWSRPQVEDQRRTQGHRQTSTEPSSLLKEKLSPTSEEEPKPMLKEPGRHSGVSNEETLPKPKECFESLRTLSEANLSARRERARERIRKAIREEQRQEGAEERPHEKVEPSRHEDPEQEQPEESARVRQKGKGSEEPSKKEKSSWKRSEEESTWERSYSWEEDLDHPEGHSEQRPEEHSEEKVDEKQDEKLPTEKDGQELAAEGVTSEPPKEETEELRLIPEDEDDPQDIWEAFVVEKVSPIRYYVMRVDDVPLYETIAALMLHDHQEWPLLIPTEGLVCCCNHRKGRWDRATVTQVYPTIKVKFMDFGMESECTNSEFRKMPPDLEKMHSLATLIEFDETLQEKYKNTSVQNSVIKIVQREITHDNVFLFGVPRTGKSVRSDQDSDSEAVDMEKLERIFSEFKPYATCELDEADKTDEEPDSGVNENSNEIFLRIKSSSTGTVAFFPGENAVRYGRLMLNQTKKDHEHARLLSELRGATDVSIRAEVGDYVIIVDREKNQHRGVVLRNFGSFYHVRLVDVGRVVEAKEVFPILYGLEKIPEHGVKVRILRLLKYEEFSDLEFCNFKILKKKKSGKWFCQVENSKFQKIGEAYLERPTQEEPYRPEFLTPESGSEVIMIATAGPDSVYIRAFDEKTRAGLKALNREVNAYGSQAGSFRNEPKIGELCCAKLSSGGMYARGIVNSIEEDALTVFFVDFGTERKIHIGYVKPLPDPLRIDPFHAIRVKLHNVSTLPWNEEADNYAEQLVEYVTPLTLTIDVSFSEGVTLTETECGTSVNNYIEENKVRRTSLPKETAMHDCMVPITDTNRKELYDFKILHVDRTLFGDCFQLLGTVPALKNHTYVTRQLSEKIRRYCAEYTKPYCPDELELCFVRYKDDWHRAMCKGMEEEQFRVILVDLGPTIVVPATEIRKGIKEYFKAPILAMRCRILEHDMYEYKPELIPETFEWINARVNTIVSGVTVLDMGVTGNAFFVSFPEIRELLFS